MRLKISYTGIQHVTINSGIQDDCVCFFISYKMALSYSFYRHGDSEH